MISRSMVDYSLYLVTDTGLCKGRELLDIIQAAVSGGVSVVQLREKNITTRAFVELARAAKAILKPFEVPLIINDRVDVMVASGADGIHVGQSDMSPADIRRMVGHECILGLSASDAAHIREASTHDLDYIGLGPIFPTETKLDAAEPITLRGLARARFLYSRAIVAIGGINLSNAEDVYKGGADGIAVVSAICSAQDPMQAAALLRSKKPRKLLADPVVQANLSKKAQNTEVYRAETIQYTPTSLENAQGETKIMPILTDEKLFQ